ncbi:hypothetical protein QQC_2523 [Clostridioides difficile Y358]|nr:hypothetical protein QQC_2523 [Clostridioides difficile Y358]
MNGRVSCLFHLHFFPVLQILADTGNDSAPRQLGCADRQVYCSVFNFFLHDSSPPASSRVNRLSCHISVVVIQIALGNCGMADNLDIASFLVIQSLLITHIAQIQAISFAFPTDRRFIGQHIENNHVLGGVIKSCQVHIGMSLVLLGTILNPLSLHQLSNRRISLHKNLLTEHLGQGYFCGEPNQL